MWAIRHTTLEKSLTQCSLEWDLLLVVQRFDVDIDEKLVADRAGGRH